MDEVGCACSVSRSAEASLPVLDDKLIGSMVMLHEVTATNQSSTCSAGDDKAVGAEDDECEVSAFVSSVLGCRHPPAFM